MSGVPVLVRNGQALTTPEANRNLYVSPAYGPPGPPGQPGANGAAGVEAITAAEALGGGRVVTGAGLHSQPGTYNLVLGLTAGAAVSGAEVMVVTYGLVSEAGWTWVPGGAVFAGPNGVMTQTPPVSGLQRQVAVAVDATSIVVDIQPSLVLG